MRAKLTTLFALVALTGAMLSTSSGGDKKPAEKKTAAEIEKLVKDLGSSNGATRDNATQGLRQTPSSRHYLRRHLEGKDLETRRRMEALIKEHARNEFKRRFGQLTKHKPEQPLDLLVEMLVENRHDVSDSEWKITVDIVSEIALMLTKEKKIRRLPDSEFDYRQCVSVVGGSIFLRDPQNYRVIADRLTLDRPFGYSIAILAQGLILRDSVGRSVVLTNGDIQIDGKKGSGERHISGSFIYCDGDFNGETMSGCIVIARGRVRSERAENCLVIEDASHSGFLKLFSSEYIGLKCAKYDKELLVDSVAPKSFAEKSGLKAGDLIEIDAKKTVSQTIFDRILRKSYVQEGDVDLIVRRAGKPQKMVISFAE